MEFDTQNHEHEFSAHLFQINILETEVAQYVQR